MSDRRSDLTPEYDEYSVAELLKQYARRSAAPAAPAEQKPAEQKKAEPQPVEQKPVEQKPAESAPAEAQETMVFTPVKESQKPATAQPPAETAGQIAERSRQAAMSALGATLRQYQQRSAAPEAPAPEEKAPEAPTPEEKAPEAPEPQEAEEPAAVSAARRPEFREPAPAVRHPRVTVGEDGIITLRYTDADEDEEAEEEAGEAEEAAPPPQAQPVPEAVSETAPPPEAEAPTPKKKKQKRPARQDGLSFRERFLAPAVRVVAKRIALRQMQKAEAESWPEPVEVRDTPELTHGKAAKYYTSLLRPLTMRFRISVLLTLILAWIGLRLPMAGMLGYSLPLQAGVSLVLLLAVMMAALDVVTAGLRQIFDLRPGAESLAAIAAILSCADAALVLFWHGETLPYCAIGAASLTAALWGEQLTCKALRRTFRTAAASKSPSYLAVGGSEDSLLRAERGEGVGIVRRSESQDQCRTVYATAAPILLGAALLLSVAASLGGRGDHFLHTFSALVSVSASFAAFIGFPLPYAMASRKLRNAGAALAGYDGCAAIGRSRRLVITDEDLFPAGTMRFAEINVVEGVFVGKAVSFTAALLSAGGGGTSALFDELVLRRGYNVPNVEEFAIHEGGGLSGLVGGERVLVGSAGFMNLMGIRLPQNLPTRNSVCTAIGGELVGVFVIEYIPVTSVQDALVTLLRSKTQTVFAIRDFNITPRMIGKLFRMPTDNFNFPSFRERYRILADSAPDAPVDAVISRSGMLPLVETAEAARNAYRTCRLSAILSLVGSGVGMVIMFLLCRVGSYDTASVGNVLLFMLLWSLPAVILSFGQNRS